MYRPKIRSKITPKFNNFVGDYFDKQINADKSFDGILNYLVNHNVISIGINDIINGRRNKKKFIISAFNCAYLWFMLLLTISILVSETLMNFLDNPMVPFNRIKQILGSISTVLFLTANLKTDMLKEESRNNLIWLKFIYYLMINDQINHKLNNYNYKIFKIITRCTYFILIQLGHLIVYIAILMFILLSIVSKSLIYIIISPIIIYAIIVYGTTVLGMLSLLYNVLIYYILRFSQINAQLHLFVKIKRIPHRKFIQIINEHNQLSLTIRKLNSIMSKSVGSLFIMTAFLVDLIIYLLIYTKSIYYKILFLYCFAAGFGAILLIDILLIKLSKSAHQSYNLMYSISKLKTLTYRMRFKVS